MPAVITHEIFGRQLYERLREAIGSSEEERDAFLLGNQGPDVLFFSAPDPTLAKAWGLGSTMHRRSGAELLEAFRQALATLPPQEQPIGRAYVLGLLCHYAADRTLHPFIYGQQYALEQASVEGLDQRDGHEIHAYIESELDELVLFTALGRTIRNFHPAKETLRGSKVTLDAISRLYGKVAAGLFGRPIPVGTFRRSTHIYRTALRLLHSPTGRKRRFLGRAERLLRHHSFLQAMSHPGVERTASVFQNRENTPWVDPYTGEMSTQGFWELYQRAQTMAAGWIEAFDGLSPEGLAAETGAVDFNGKPTDPEHQALGAWTSSSEAL